MHASKKFDAKPAPRQFTKRQRLLKTMGMEEEKYRYTHGWDQVYRAWSGATPDFALYTKLLGVQPPKFKTTGIWGSCSAHAHVLYYPISKGFSMSGNPDHRRLFIPRIEKWIFENAYTAIIEEPISTASSSSQEDNEGEDGTAITEPSLADIQMKYTLLAEEQKLFADSGLVTAMQQPSDSLCASSTATSSTATQIKLSTSKVGTVQNSTGAFRDPLFQTSGNTTQSRDSKMLSELAGFADSFVAKLMTQHSTHLDPASKALGISLTDSVLRAQAAKIVSLGGGLTPSSSDTEVEEYTPPPKGG